MLKHTGRVFFDGVYVTNGHVAFKASLGKLADETLQALVKGGKPFALERGVCKIEEGIPDIKEKFILPENAVSVDLKEQGYRMCFKKWAVKISGLGTESYIAEDYADFMESLKPQSYMLDNDGMLYVILEDEVIAVCCPVVF